MTACGRGRDVEAAVVAMYAVLAFMLDGRARRLGSCVCSGNNEVAPTRVSGIAPRRSPPIRMHRRHTQSPATWSRPTFGPEGAVRAHQRDGRYLHGTAPARSLARYQEDRTRGDFTNAGREWHLTGTPEIVQVQDVPNYLV